MVELMDEEEAEVSVIVGDVLPADVLVNSDVLELAGGHFCNSFRFDFSQVKILWDQLK